MMLNQAKLVGILLKNIPNIRLIYLFGSQADGTSTAQSDIDIAVLLDRKIDPVVRYDLEQTLILELGQEVDLVDLLSASTVLQNQVVMRGTLIYGSRSEQASFEMQVMSMYQHLNEERSEIVSAYLNE